MPVPGPARPTTVTAAGLILCAVATGWLLNAAVWSVGTAGVVDRFRAAAARAGIGQPATDTAASEAWEAGLGLALVAALVAALLIGLAVGDLRGSPTARVLTLVTGGIGELASCWVLGFISEHTPEQGDATTTGTVTVNQLLNEAYPDWWTIAFAGACMLHLVASIAVVLLLLLPAARRYFAEPEAGRGRTDPPYPVVAQPF